MKEIIKNEDGFTTAEVIIALAVLGVMAFFVFLAVSGIHFILKYW